MKLNKKSMTRIGAVILILIIFGIVLFSITISSAILTKDKFVLGEKVKMNLRGYGSYRMKIITPSTSYIKTGMNNIILFTPKKVGEYKIELNYGRESESYFFEVFENFEDMDNVSDETNNQTNQTDNNDTHNNQTVNNSANNDSQTNYTDTNLTQQNQTNNYTDDSLINNSHTNLLFDRLSLDVESEVVVGEYIKWVRSENIGIGTRRTKISIPRESKYIKVLRESIPGFFDDTDFLINEKDDEIAIILNNVYGNIEIEYYTEGPKKEEKIINKHKKEVKVHYDDIFIINGARAYTEVEEIASTKKGIRVYWKEENRYVDFEAYDFDDDGFIDNIKWDIEHLSNQTFEIILISSAQHLDEDKNFLADIYPEVYQLDNNWSEKIYHSEYIRVTFEENLTNDKDITVYTRNIDNSSTKIEVYYFNSTEKITEFPVLFDEGMFKIFLTNLTGSHDTFDLKIVNLDGNESSYLEFDLIIDPVAEPGGPVELKAHTCYEQSDQGTQDNFPTECDSGSYPGTCTSGDDDVSCDDANYETASSQKNTYGGIKVETFNASVADCDSIDQVFLCHSFWGGDVAKHVCYVGADNDGSWDDDVTVSCLAADPAGVTCINVTADENWNCSDFFGVSDGTMARAKAQAIRTTGSGAQTWTFDALFFNVSYTMKDIIAPEVTINFPVHQGNYSPADMPLNFNVTLNEPGSVQYNFDGGLFRKTMKTLSGDAVGQEFNATNSSIADGEYTIYIFANDTANIENHTETADFTYDSTPPIISYQDPTENSGIYLNQNNIDVNISSSDTLVGLDTIEIRLYNADFSLNQSNSSATSPYYINYSGLADGFYYYNATANDTVNNTNRLALRNITLDTTYPLVNYTVGTPEDGKRIRGNAVYVNASVNETNEANATFLLYNSSGQVFKNNFVILPIKHDINWTGLNDGIYFYNVTITDFVNLKNTTLMRNVTLDNQNPLVTVNQPSFSGINYSQTSVIFNITLNEDGGTVIYDLGDGNVTMATHNNREYYAINSSIADGQYEVDFYVNDSAGNSNYSIAYKFGIDNINPSLNLAHPTAKNYTTNSIDINFTANDENSGLESCWYSTDLGETNVSIDNCINTTFASPEDTVNLYVYVNDTAGNINFSENVTYYVDSIEPLVEFEAQTRPNNTNWEFDWIYANVSVVEDNFANITYELFNFSAGGASVNKSVFYTLVQSINWTGLNNTNINYTYQVTVYDELGNVNITETRLLTLTPGDIQGPVVTINSPIADEFINVSSVLFNVTLDEDGSLVEYSLIGGLIANITMSTTDDRVYNATNSSIADGEYEVWFYANDTLGNPSAYSQNFTIDTTFPLIDFVSTDYYLSYNESKFSYSGFPSNPNNARDNDWSTFSRVDADAGIDILFFNYSVPVGEQNAVLEYYTTYTILPGKFDCYNTTNDWKVITSVVGGTRTNVSIPEDCFSEDLLQIRFYRDLVAESGSVDIYEQQVHWNITALTEPDFSNLSQDFIITNVIVDELNEANMTFRLYNDSEEINTSTFFSVVRAINWTGLDDGTYYYNITIVDLATNTNSTVTRAITLDTTDSNATLLYPANGTLNKTTSQNLTVNITDNIEIKNATLFVYNGSFDIVNQTDVVIGVSKAVLGVVYVFVDGVFRWFYQIFDIAGNVFITNNNTITIDATVPLIAYGDGTENNGEEFERNFVYVNVTFTEENFENITFELYNDTSGTTLVNRSIFYTPTYTINWADLSDLNVTYYYNVTIRDFTKNKNFTPTYSIKLVDITNPSLTLTDPDNKTYDYNESIPITYSASDEHLETCWYTLDGGSANILAGCASTTIDVSDDSSHTVVVYANDSLGLTNSSSVTFFVNTSAIETNEYLVQRGTALVDGSKSVSIIKSDALKSFSLIDVRSSDESPETLQVITEPAGNRTALNFENYNGAVNVSWEYITGPGIISQRGLATYNDTETGMVVIIGEIDITEGFIIINNRLNSIYGDAYAKGLWTAKFINDTAIVLNRSQSGAAGNVSWQVVQWDGATIKSGDATISGLTQEAHLASSVNPDNSLLIFSSRVTDSGEIIESRTAAAYKVIWGSVDAGALTDTYAYGGGSFDILATAGYETLLYQLKILLREIIS